MRKSRNIIIMVVVLGILTGSYFFLANKPKSNESEPEDEKIPILSLEKDDIVRMELNNEHGQLIFNRGEKEVAQEQTGDNEKIKQAFWEVESPFEILLKQFSVDSIADSFAKLEAERVVEENTPKDLDPYGLKEPKAVAVAVLKDGTEHTLYLGDETPVGNSFYLMKEGDPRVYEVRHIHGEHFSYALDDVRDKDFLPQVDMQEFAYMKIDKRDGRPFEIIPNDDTSGGQSETSLSKWLITGAYDQPKGLSPDAMNKFAEKISGFTIKEFVEEEAQDLSLYGLDKENAWEFILKDSENTLHILIGKEYDEDMVYIKTVDSPAVYGIDKAKIGFMDITAFDLVDKFAYIISIDAVDGIEVKGLGKSHNLTMMRRDGEKPAGEDEEAEVITTYRVDGRVVEEDPFKEVYQNIIGIQVDNEIGHLPVGNPEIRFTFYLNQGKTKEVHIDYVPYDNDFYAVFKNGKTEFLVNKAEVQKVLGSIDALATGDIGH